MEEPTFHGDGTPTDETLAFIEQWEVGDTGLRDHVLAKVDFVIRAMDSTYGTVRHSQREDDCGQLVDAYEIVTGGWSNNEMLVSALNRNPAVRVHWASWKRGGLFVYEIPFPKGGDPCQAES